MTKKHTLEKRKTSSQLYDKTTLLCLVGLIVLLVVGILFFGCNKKTNPASYAEPYYEMDVVFDGEEVTLTETVVYQNSTNAPLTSLAFHLYPNAFKENAECSPFDEKERNLYHHNNDFGGIEVLEVKIDRLTCDFVLSCKDDTIVEIPCSVDTGESVVVEFQCVVDLPRCNHRLGKTDNSINLTGFYPVLCGVDESGWLKNEYHHFGDPFVLTASTYFVTFTYPDNYTAYGSGKCTTTSLDIDDSSDDNNNYDNMDDNSVKMKKTEFYGECIRDFAIILSEDFVVNTATAKVGDGVTVDYFSITDQNPQDTLCLAVDVIEKFSSAFGDYPYSTYTLVECDMACGGMEYGSLSVVSSPDKNAVIHETAHQWWYGVVGNDQVNHHWLDEGLAEFSTIYYHLLKGDESAFKRDLSAIEEEYKKWAKMSNLGFDGVMDKPIYKFLTSGEYVATAYVKGAVLFATLREIMGDKDFQNALKTYYTENKFKIATPAGLITCFEKHHPGISGVITPFIEGKDK